MSSTVLAGPKWYCHYGKGATYGPFESKQACEEWAAKKVHKFDYKRTTSK